MRFFSIFIGLIFALLFTGAGLMIAKETVLPTYLDWQSMKTWQSTTARITSLNQSENHLSAQYSYRIDGIRYHNNRVYVATFKDNIGNYHQQLYQRLSQAKKNHHTIIIWYDPAQPSQAVIDRSMRWGLFSLMLAFCSVFILIGLLSCYFSIFSRGSPSQNTLQTMYSVSSGDQANGQVTVSNTANPTVVTKPWLQRNDWRTNRIHSGVKSRLYWLWLITFVWMLICIPVIKQTPMEFSKGNHSILFAMSLPVAGLLLLYFSIKKTIAWRRFGYIELQLDPFPGSIGGHVGGNLFLNNIKDFRTPFWVELQCAQSYISGSGKNRTRREKIIWAERGQADAKSSGRGLRLEFRFSVPDHLPDAEAKPRNEQYYFWRLKLDADLEPITLKRSYNIPVYQTHQKSETARHDLSTQQAQFKQQQQSEQTLAIQRADFASTPLSKVLQYRDFGYKQQFYYPMLRHKVLTFIALIFAAGFSFAAYQINLSFAEDGPLKIIMFLFSIPFGLVGLFATVAFIYLPLNNLTVTLKRNQISTLRRLGFIPVSRHDLQARELEKIEVKSSGSTGEGVEKIRHFKLMAHTPSGKKITIAEDIDGEILAEGLRDFIQSKVCITN